MPKTITTEVHFTLQVWKWQMEHRGGAEKAEYSDSLLFLNLLVEGFDFLPLSLLPALDLPLKKKYLLSFTSAWSVEFSWNVALYCHQKCRYFYFRLQYHCAIFSISLLSLVPQQFPDVCCGDSVLETFLWVPSGPKLFIFCIWTLASISSKFGFEIQTQFSWNDSIDFHVVLLSTRSTSNGPLYW